MAGEALLALFFFPSSLSELLSAAWLPKSNSCVILKVLNVIFSKQKQERKGSWEEAGRPLWQVAEQLAHVITQEGAHQEGATDPDCAAIGFYIPQCACVCVCVSVITPRMLHFRSLFPSADPTWSSHKKCCKKMSASSPFCLPVLLCAWSKN